jgi:dTDP-4-dehydrorhamnose reductase
MGIDDMKALVIGGQNGQVARALSGLDDAQFTIEACGRPEIDLARPDSLGPALAASSPEVVINCAAYTAVDQAETDRDAAHAINADGPGRLSNICADAGIPLIHLSTDYVFDGLKSGPYIETDPTSPQSVYGATKFAGEAAVAMSGARHVVLRISWVHAPFGKNFVRTMLRLAGSRDRLNVVADQIGRPSYAPHLAIALRDIAARLVLDADAPTGVFHLTGSGEPCSWREFAQTVFEASRVRGGPTATADPIPTSNYPTPAKRPANSVLDCSKIEAAFGLRLPHWRQGVEECIAAIAADGWNLS